MHGSELIIRTKKQNQTHELIPITALEGDFPRAFVQNYAHWLDLKTGFVEWRPSHKTWTASPENWQMRSDHSGENFLTRGSLRLIDIFSPTANAVSKLLSPLADVTNLHITHHYETKMLEVHLPQLKLDFFLKREASQLESKQFRGMVVDANQSFGALTGLVNKLVIRADKNSRRSVIIPHGEVHFTQKGYHVCAGIDGSTPPLSYHIYHIDCQLGRLVDNGTLTSRLFKCYLHAITAHCLVDELTGRTGTEEALLTLGSPFVLSFLEHEQTDIDLLMLLAKLTPSRQYYPRSKRVMQEVKWASLSSLSQHSSFSKLVSSILEEAKAFNSLIGKTIKVPDVGLSIEKHLLERAAIRDSTYRVDGFGAENHTSEYDVAYAARDSLSDSNREPQVYQISKLIHSWSKNLKCCSNLLGEIQSWGMMLRGCDTTEKFSLGYDMKWLNANAEVFAKHWCSLQIALSTSSVDTDKYRIMIFFSTLVISPTINPEIIQTLLAFATVSELRSIKPPDHSMFDLSHGFQPNPRKLREIVGNYARSLPSRANSDLSRETYPEDEVERRDRYQATLKWQIEAFVDILLSRRTGEDVHVPAGTEFSTYIFVEKATENTSGWFKSWRRNAEFKDYIDRAQVIMDGLNAGDQSLARYSLSLPPYQHSSQLCHIGIDDIMSRPAPSPSPFSYTDFGSWVMQEHIDQGEQRKLKSLLERLLPDSASAYEQRYVQDLIRSLNSLQDSADVKFHGTSQVLQPLLESHLMLCKKRVESLYHAICDCLQAEPSITRRLAYKSRMWPRLTTTSLLQNLSHVKVLSLRIDWKDALVEYGLAISALQRAERLLGCIESELELVNELSNPGHQGWDIARYPDWLLLEIENNIMIRQVQAQIAHEMISPSTGMNSILQLNMGQGKSSVIVPIVAAALADGKKLVRVVVLKSLATQMLHVLLSKLGGILNRRIFHMPISRSTILDMSKAKQIYQICKECIRTGGIFLVQPEHLLSFELMGLEGLLADDSRLGSRLIQIQRLFNDHSRDILDESDEILNARFELIYTIGIQRAIEFSPNRWTIVEQVFGLLRRFVQPVLHLYPQGLQLQSVCSGSFPRLRVLQPAASNQLMRLIAQEVCDAGLPGVPVWNLPESVRKFLYEFLINSEINRATIEMLEVGVFSVDSMRRSFLLLRGLISGGVLAFALQQKRWRVNYGPDLSRTMLAVPYRAKDSPAARAEFSHPDTAIVLTCLSYYYGGLSDQQLYVAFQELLKCDHAQEEYEQWIQDAPDLPPAFWQLSGVNLSNPAQCSQVIFRFLRLAKGVIDFYMSHVVFPTEMMDFPSKLSSSGWDIARAKGHPTTGFSGTNDCRYILPLSIGQLNLPAQSYTNAAVLECLLRPENSFQHSMQDSESEVFDGESLLQIVAEAKPPVRVILDVGAQVLEWNNEEIARRWLSRVPESAAQAIVFFNDCNDLLVLSREGVMESLMTSHFAKQMDQCLVYLDEVHTRGTDLKLPSNYRAVVTLGPDLTKDRLVQGKT